MQNGLSSVKKQFLGMFWVERGESGYRSWVILSKWQSILAYLAKVTRMGKPHRPPFKLGSFSEKIILRTI